MKHRVITLDYSTTEDWKELDSRHVEMIELAAESMNSAYAPYSEYKVGAVVEFEDGTVEVGNNQENAAYPSGMCAERVALFSAKAKFPDKSIKTIYIITHSTDGIPAAPCGSCRQVIKEVSDRQSSDIQLYIANSGGGLAFFEDATSLLPLGFGPEALKKG
ncbi:MAG: cytidine deaminase [Flavobacteriales bacterium]|nr:cytidine deaminase [Flavobacteriales bacterium]